MDLIVTADDFGYSPIRDDVILDCFQRGIVTGTSLLVNGCSAESAVKKGKACGICIGLHLNLSEGIPITAVSQIPSLVVEINGVMQFRGKQGFIDAVEKGDIDCKDVEVEFRNQIARFIDLMGVIPCYVDGHQHVHLYPCLAETIAKVMYEFGISRTRFPSEDMGEVSWMNSNPRKAFRQHVYENTLATIPIYVKYGVYGGFGIGSSLGGMNMSSQRVINCCLRYPRSRFDTTTIEFMTHPAVPHENIEKWGCGTGCDDFSQSQDRVHEYDILTDPYLRQNLQDKGIRLCSYATSHLEPQKTNDSETKKRIIMMLSLKEGTGNTITGTRVASVLMDLGFVTQMVDSTDHFEKANIHAIIGNQRYKKFPLQSLFCIHALRSGVFALDTGVPFVLMLGGTDINVNAQNPEKVEKLKEVIQHASHIIAFTEDMKNRTINLLQDKPIPPISVIPQSTQLPQTRDTLLRDLLHLTPTHRLVVLPSGLRPIKDVCFVLDVFSEYHKKHPETVLCIIGPILDANYANSLFSKLPAENLIGVKYEGEKEANFYEGVYYASPIPHTRFLGVLMDTDVVINSSISEGFAAIVLESWSAKKILIARENSGNCAVIRDGVSGLLYKTPEEFIHLLDHVLSDEDYRHTLEQSSYDYFISQGLIENEKRELQRIFCGKKKPLKQKKTDKSLETDEDRAFKAKQKEEQAALKAMREKLGKKK